MIVCSRISTCANSFFRLSERVQRQMATNICCLVSQGPSSSCRFYLYPANVKTFSCPSVSLQSFRTSCFRSGFSKQRSYFHSLTVKYLVCSRRLQTRCLGISLARRYKNIRLLVPKHGMLPKIKCNVRPVCWRQGCASAVLTVGLLVGCSNSKPVHAETSQEKGDNEVEWDQSRIKVSHGKKVYTEYAITGIPGDGRCLFRSVAHGACLLSGKPAPSKNHQRELADELRARVANEFIKRRKETEWFVEGDFETYVSQIRKPHVWGGEPELFMASHVLQMPITVYMYDKDAGGLISIAEYGQEYGKDNPIRVLYHGFGHYESLQIPGKIGGRSRL